MPPKQETHGACCPNRLTWGDPHVPWQCCWNCCATAREVQWVRSWRCTQQKHHDRYHRLFLSCSNMVDDCIWLWYGMLEIEWLCMKVCSTSALQINSYISLRLIPSLAEAVARIHEAGICDMRISHIGKESDSNQVLVEFAEIGILSLRHFDLQEVSTGVPTQARFEGFEMVWGLTY